MSENKNWFELWFDSPYYPILYKNRDQEEASLFIDKIIENLEPGPESKILDLACGEGRHSIHLNSMGFEVVGIDLSKRSINNARNHSNNKLSFFVHDMRTFKLDQKFDLILNLFTSFGYFEEVSDNEKVLQHVHEHLSDEGVFIIDFFNSTKVIKDLVPYENKAIDGVDFKIKKEVKEGHIIKEIAIDDQGSRSKFFEKVQLFTESEIDALLHKHHFIVLNKYGDYQLNKFDDQKSKRLIIFAAKLKQ